MATLKTEREGLGVEESSTLECGCASKHVPKPLHLVDRAGTKLCPTSACNLDALVLEWLRHAGEPPGYVTKRYGAYVRLLARQTYQAQHTEGE
jgi:hypothetical protein